MTRAARALVIARNLIGLFCRNTSTRGGPFQYRTPKKNKAIYSLNNLSFLDTRANQLEARDSVNATGKGIYTELPSMKCLLTQILWVVTAAMVTSCGGSLGRAIEKATRNEPHRECATTKPKFNTADYKTVAVVGSCEEIASEVEAILVRTKQYQVVDLRRAFDSGNSSGVDAQVIIECSGSEVKMRVIDSQTSSVVAAEFASKDAQYEGLNAASYLAGAIVPIQHCWKTF